MRGRVLIVEDDPAIRELATESLEEFGGYEVQSAIGQDAIDCARTWKPDVILLDIFLPQMDGVEIAETLREHPKTRQIPIIVMSANTRIDEFAAAVGTPYVLRKPMTIDELLEIVGRVTGQDPSHFDPLTA